MAMTGLFARGWRGAVGLIAAYAIALQTLFAAFAPLPANAGNALGADFGPLSVLCFGSGNAGSDGDPDAPAHTSSGKFHCVLCGSSAAGAAVLPDAAGAPLALPQFATHDFLRPVDASMALAPARAGLARAPPLTV